MRTQSSTRRYFARVTDVSEVDGGVRITATTHDGDEISVLSETDAGEWAVEHWYRLLVTDASGAEPRILDADDRGDAKPFDDWLYNDFGLHDHQNPVSNPAVTRTMHDQSSVGGQSQSKSFSAGSQMSASVDSVNAEAAQTQAADPDDLGFAVGGEKDGNNFRDNIHEGYVPEPAAVATEGIYYDYYFDTGETDPRDDTLFYPSYSRAITRHPATREIEEFLTVGLNSNLSPDEFERPTLDLVVVLDISGSMKRPFDDYYYDENGRRREVEGGGEEKIDAAIDALQGLTEELDDDDRLGVVLYNNDAMKAKPLRAVNETDMDAIRDHAADITAGGGTDLSAGFDLAAEMLADSPDGPDRESRVVFLTDEMPNRGVTDADELVSDFERVAADGIYTTFVGVGLDANADLGDRISEVRGANHYFIHSGDEFRQRLAEEFEYMVSPLVFDLSLEIESDSYDVVDVYGAPSTDGDLLHVSTLFPSPAEGGRTRGGVILVRLRRTGDNPELGLKAAWERRDGTTEADVVTPAFDDPEPEHFDNDGICKAVELARYAEEVSAWAADARDRVNGAGDGEWEHGSVEVDGPGDHADHLEAVRDRLAELAAEVDSELEQEVDVLNEILSTDESSIDYD